MTSVMTENRSASTGAISRHIVDVCGDPRSSSNGRPQSSRRTLILAPPVSAGVVSKLFIHQLEHDGICCCGTKLTHD